MPRLPPLKRDLLRELPTITVEHSLLRLWLSFVLRGLLRAIHDRLADVLVRVFAPLLVTVIKKGGDHSYFRVH